MVAECSLVLQKQQLGGACGISPVATSSPAPMNAEYRAQLVSVISTGSTWQAERRFLVLTLLEDSLCRLSAIHAEVLLRWRMGCSMPSWVASSGSLSPDLVRRALQQDADSGSPVVLTTGSTPLDPATDISHDGKQPRSAWQHVMVQLHVPKLAKLVGVGAPTHTIRADDEGSLPPFLFDYESPTEQSASKGGPCDTSSFNIGVAVTDDQTPPGSLLDTRDDTPHAADVAGTAGHIPDTPLIHRGSAPSSLTTTTNAHLLSPVSVGPTVPAAAHAFHSDSYAVPQEVATCWDRPMASGGLSRLAQQGSHQLPADLNGDVGSYTGTLTYAPALQARARAPSVSGASRGGPMSPHYPASASAAMATSAGCMYPFEPAGADGYESAGGTPGRHGAWGAHFAGGGGGAADFGAFPAGIAASVQPYPPPPPPPPPPALTKRPSGMPQPPSPVTSAATAYSPTGSGGGALFMKPPPSLSNEPYAYSAVAGAAPASVASDEPGSATGAAACGRRASDGSVGGQAMDLESALEAIISYESGSTATAAETGSGGSGTSAGSGGVSAATAAAAHSSLQHHVQAAVRAAGMCTMPPGQTDTPSGLDMNMHFGRMSLEGTGLTRGLSGYSNGLTNALSTGLDVTGGQVVGSAPSHVGGGGGNAGFMPHIDAPPLHTAFNSAAAAAAAATYASRLTAPELPMSPDALSATTPAEIAAAAAAAARGVGGPGLSALSRSVPRTASGGWAAVAAQRKRTLNALATMAGAQAGGGFPGDAAPLGLLHGAGFAAGAGAGGKAPRLWSLLSPKLRNEVQQMLAHLPGIRGEDLDDGVLYQLISTRQQADEEVLAALRAVAAMSMDLTSPPAAAAAALASHPSLSAFLPAASKAQGDGLTSPPFSPHAGGSMLRHASSMPTPLSKAALQKLPSKVLTRLEEVVGRCAHLDWKHFDAGVIKVMVQLSDLSEADVLEELQLLEATDLSNVEYMPAYLNKRLNNRLWSRRKLQQAQQQQGGTSSGSGTGSGSATQANA